MLKNKLEGEKSLRGKKAFLLTFPFLFSLMSIDGLKPLINPINFENQTRITIKKVVNHPLKKTGQTQLLNKNEEKSRVKKSSENQPPAKIQPKGQVNLPLLIENKFLEEEYSLAKNPQYYFVLNLKDKKTELRARGMVLKSWTASQVRYSGRPVPLKVATLKQKSALNPPQRKMIKPGESEIVTTQSQANQAKKQEKTKSDKAVTAASPDSQEFQLEALEITDMPTSYELILDNGLRISVRSKISGRRKMQQAVENILWYIWLPVKNFVINRKNPETRMILYFDNPRDAQGLYWAFIDGIKGIIWLP